MEEELPSVERVREAHDLSFRDLLDKSISRFSGLLVKKEKVILRWKGYGSTQACYLCYKGVYSLRGPDGEEEVCRRGNLCGECPVSGVNADVCTGEVYNAFLDCINKAVYLLERGGKISPTHMEDLMAAARRRQMELGHAYRYVKEDKLCT